MPWQCKQCATDVTDDVTSTCPSCGTAKTAWTLVQDRTRTMVVTTRRKLEPMRSDDAAARTPRAAPYDAAPWALTDVVAAMPKGRARALLAQGLLPAPADLLTVRAPTKAGGATVRVTVLPEAARARDVDLAASAPGGDGFVDARVLPVFGALDDDVGDIVVPGVLTLDVSDETDRGHAPTLEVSIAGKSPRRVRVEAPGIVRVLLTGLLCDLDRTFLLPDGVPAMKALRRIQAREVPREVLVVGHTDASGQPDYNVGLSVRRAEVVEAFLRDDVDAWLAWYTTPHAQGKPWGTIEDQHMLSALADDAGRFYTGPIDGADWSPATRDAVRRFQAHANAALGAGLAEDGISGPQTRRWLVRAYMAEDDTTLPVETSARIHGCGEYHPAVATADGVTEDENRRIEVFLFPGGVAPPPQEPCPAPAGCAEHAQWLANTVRTIDLREGLGHLDVRVVDTRGQPIADAALHLLGVGADQGRTTADGRHLFADQVPGEATLVASRQGFIDGSVAVEVPAGWATREVDVVLAPNVVDVVMARRPGRPVVFDRLTLRSDDGEFERTLALDEALPLEGERVLFRFTDLPMGKTFAMHQRRGAVEWVLFRRVGAARLLPRGENQPPERTVLEPQGGGA